MERYVHGIRVTRLLLGFDLFARRFLVVYLFLSCKSSFSMRRTRRLIIALRVTQPFSLLCGVTVLRHPLLVVTFGSTLQCGGTRFRLAVSECGTSLVSPNAFRAFLVAKPTALHRSTHF